MTGIAALSVLVPLARAGRSQADATAGADEAVYREQLTAIESELERGLIGLRHEGSVGVGCGHAGIVRATARSSL
ncbi:MAG: c-type cytochrome biogenesis protein CcmI, partial [Pseudomonadota bacterium]